MCGGFHGAFLTIDNALLDHRTDHGIFGNQITFQMFFILGTDIQSSAQRLELLDCYTQTFNFKLPNFVGLANKYRVSAKKFAFGKVVQRSVKQRNSSTADAAGDIKCPR
ncbi:hypothetical protein D3C87_1138780 [compost metagenome]